MLQACGTVEQPTPIPTPLPTNTPVPTATIDLTQKDGKDITIALPEGDIDNGRYLTIRWRCIACHLHEGFPTFESKEGEPPVYERAAFRIADPDYAGSASTPEEYLVEAIVLPGDYLVPGEWEKQMDDNFDDRLSIQDIADIIAWLQAQE